MTITDVQRDLEQLTMTVTAEFDADVDAVWQLWADPRTLERWWGPPTYPATVTDHDLTAGGTVRYSMTGPEGDTHGGWWTVLEVEAPRRLKLRDGFADEHGDPNPDMPTMVMHVDIAPIAGSGRTRMTVLTEFPSLEQMQQLVEMGMEEGMREAWEQIDALLVAA